MDRRLDIFSRREKTSIQASRCCHNWRVSMNIILPVSRRWYAMTALALLTAPPLAAAPKLPRSTIRRPMRTCPENSPMERCSVCLSGTLCKRKAGSDALARWPNAFDCFMDSAATACSGLDSERLLRADLRFQVRRGRRRAGGGGGRGGGGRRR